MKTRAQIYGLEATELLRIVTMYPGLSDKQLCGFFPGKADKIRNLLSHLRKQGRIIEDAGCSFFPAGITSPCPDSGLVRAVWVLLDFIGRVEYHSASEFPSRLVFFLDGEIYEIIHTATGQEALVCHILRQGSREDGRRIVLVDSRLSNALDTTDIQRYPDNYEVLSTDAALRAEKIACRLRHLIYAGTNIKKADYLDSVADVHGIEVCYENGIMEVTLPSLLPKRKQRQSTEFLLDPFILPCSGMGRNTLCPTFRTVWCASPTFTAGNFPAGEFGTTTIWS